MYMNLLFINNTRRHSNIITKKNNIILTKVKSFIFTNMKHFIFTNMNHRIILFFFFIKIILYLQERRVSFSQTFYFHKHESSYNIILLIDKIILYLQERRFMFVRTKHPFL